MAMLGSPRILCVSRTSFVSSSVLAPSKASHWGSTLNAIWCGYTEATAGSPASTVLRLLAQLLDGAGARAGDRLVGRHGHVGEAGGVVQRLQRGDQLDGRAVRVGDDAAVPGDGLGVDLGHDQRHVGVHPEGARLVDDDAAARHRLGREARRGRCAGREQRQVEALERVGGQLPHLELAAGEGHPPAGGAGRRERRHLGGREAALGQHLEHDRPDRAGGADNGDAGARHRRPRRLRPRARPGTPRGGRRPPRRPGCGRSRTTP